MLVLSNHQKPKVVTFGEILARLSPKNYLRLSDADQLQLFYGGSEANVSASLAILGLSSFHVGVLPDNDLGNAALMQFKGKAVNTDFIIKKEGRMGLYFLEEGIAQRPTRVIYDRFDSAFSTVSNDEFDWETILEGAEWFHWSGITPAISQGAAQSCRKAIITASKLGIKISGDINYRRNLWNYGKNPGDIMPELIQYSNVIVGSTGDYSNCLGKNFGEEYESASRMLMEEFPKIELCAKTSRKTINASRNKLSAHMVKKNEAYCTNKIDIYPIRDRVGSGDAFMSGIIYGMLNQMNLEAIAQFALAAAVLKHTTPGDVNTASIEEILNLAKGENTGNLLR